MGITQLSVSWLQKSWKKQVRRKNTCARTKSDIRWSLHAELHVNEYLLYCGMSAYYVCERRKH